MFDDIADSFRSPKVWVKDDKGTWHKKIFGTKKMAVYVLAPPII